MTGGEHCEIERKYLIRYPDPDQLRRMPGCEVWDITQIYLTDGEGGVIRRIRKVVEDGEERYFRTFKRRLSGLSCVEDEGEIAREDYELLRLEGDPSRRPVLKTRYRVPYAGHVLEFDLYPFWQDRAILEIELSDEAEAADIPEHISVIRDVSREKAYKNLQLAKRVPMEAL